MKIESIIKRPGGTVIDMDAPKRAYKFVPEDGVHESPHVAEVDVESHARALLRIREGFRLVEGEAPLENIAVNQLDHSETLIGSNVHNASYVIKGGDTIQLGDLVVMAFQDSGLTHDQWNELADQERYDFIDATLRELQLGEAEDEGEQPAPVQEKKAGAESESATGDEQPVAKQEPESEAGTEGVTGNNADGQTEQKAEEEQPKEEAPKEDAPKAEAAEPSIDELRERFKTKFGRYPSTQMKVENIVAALSEDDE